jgi:hypothetical protein
MSVIAIPHAATKDDIYEGFLIPKGVYSLHSHIGAADGLTDVCLTRRDRNWKFMVSNLHFP